MTPKSLCVGGCAWVLYIDHSSDRLFFLSETKTKRNRYVLKNTKGPHLKLYAVLIPFLQREFRDVSLDIKVSFIRLMFDRLVKQTSFSQCCVTRKKKTMPSILLPILQHCKRGEGGFLFQIIRAPTLFFRK